MQVFVLGTGSFKKRLDRFRRLQLDRSGRVKRDASAQRRYRFEHDLVVGVLHQILHGPVVIEAVKR